MKVSDIYFATPTSKAASSKLGRQVQKSGVAADKQPRLNLGVVGLSIGQTQSTGLTSRVGEELLVEAPSTDRVELIKDLLVHTDSNYKMKLVPEQLDEAMDEAIVLLRRVWKGHDDTAINDTAARLKETMKKIRLAVQPLRMHHHSFNDAGVWIKNDKMRGTIETLEKLQPDLMNAHFFFHNLHELLLAMSGLLRLYVGGAGHDGRMSTRPDERAFLAAAFKKLGIM